VILRLQLFKNAMAGLVPAIGFSNDSP
jgi:hypothetical protein